MKKALSIFGNIFYTAIVLVVLAFTLLFVGTRIDLLGYEVKVVQSGSMEPAIMTGGIVIISPAAPYNIGDVITFGSDVRGNVPVTHRVVDRTYEGTRATYLTKGDANEEADSKAVAHSEVIGKVVFTLPYVGYVIDFARTPLGFALLVGIPALLIVLDELANIMWEFHKYRYFKRKNQVREREKLAKTRRETIRAHSPVFGDIPKTPAQIAREQQRASARPYESHTLDLRNYRTKSPAI